MEYTIESLLTEVNSVQSAPGNERARAIIEHVTKQIFDTMVKFDVSHEEMWAFFRSVRRR